MGKITVQLDSGDMATLALARSQDADDAFKRERYLAARAWYSEAAEWWRLAHEHSTGSKARDGARRQAQDCEANARHARDLARYA